MPGQSTHTAPPGNDQTLVYLVRHAQTAWNLERRFQGQLDVPLSEEGVRQAEAVAKWLGGQQVLFSALYTSDLLRARQTARPIGERLGLVPQPVRALREIYAGEWQGLLTGEIEQRYPGQLARWYEQPHTFRLPGGETIPEVRARVLAWYLETVAAHRGEAIVVVSHGMAIRSLLSALNGWDIADTEMMKASAMGNTGVTVLLADHGSQHSALLYHNSLGHLQEATRPPQAQERDNEPATV